MFGGVSNLLFAIMFLDCEIFRSCFFFSNLVSSFFITASAITSKDFINPPPLPSANLVPVLLQNSSLHWSIFSTLGFTKGKFYYEAEFESGSYFKLGFVSDDSTPEIGHIGQAAIDAGYAWYMNSGGEVRTDDAVISGWAGSDITNISTITTGDIMKVAVDMDNKFAYFGVNNVWAKNADPTSGSSGTGGFSISSEYTGGQEQKILLPAVSVYNASCHLNFGNGYFGTTAVSSPGTNASGNGIFEHDVPAGYTAVSTKGINSF